MANSAKPVPPESVAVPMVPIFVMSPSGDTWAQKKHFSTVHRDSKTGVEARDRVQGCQVSWEQQHNYNNKTNASSVIRFQEICIHLRIEIIIGESDQIKFFPWNINDASYKY